MRPVSIVSTAQLPVMKANPDSLSQMAATVISEALQSASVTGVEALYVSNMLADELQSQKHLGALFADEAGLHGVEAMRIGAATAGGAAALRVAYLAVASGDVDLAMVVGAEKMSEGSAVPALAKALDAKLEVPLGANMINRNAELMRMYMERYKVPKNGFANFAVNAHKNAKHNPNAMFRKPVSAATVQKSRVIYAPLRLYDSAPICDGAAAVLLAPTDQARAYTKTPVHMLASSVATDYFRLEDRPSPLHLRAAEMSAEKAFRAANVTHSDISLFEVHDAFTIMSALQLEAAGFAAPGRGWRLAHENKIGLKGKIPITTMGGLKARGHPIGATALYQTCELVLQLTEQAGKNQVRKPKVGMMQSIGGVASTVVTHILGN
ncbi:MAG: thiolase domain-containing protein [Anaerolineales bacterium]|nr:MAG: thiolase domain-containing protein [Anaerolineales bacterium]